MKITLEGAEVSAVTRPVGPHATVYLWNVIGEIEAWRKLNPGAFAEAGAGWQHTLRLHLVELEEAKKVLDARCNQYWTENPGATK